MNNQNKSSKQSGSCILWLIVFIVLLLIIVIGSVWCVTFSIAKGVSAATGSFKESYEEAREETYKKYHDMAYKISEDEHHVSNRATISIREVKEKAALEVLRVNDVAYIITDKTENEAGTTSWLKVYGTGVFTVNLIEAEYVIDNQRGHVLVRVPKPVIDSNSISINNAEVLRFKESVFDKDNSVDSGEELAREQLGEAKQRIQEDFEQNEQYFKFAEDSTTSMLTALIKGFNPEVKDLQVEVEFY